MIHYDHRKLEVEVEQNTGTGAHRYTGGGWSHDLQELLREHVQIE